MRQIMDYSTSTNQIDLSIADKVSNALFGKVEAEAWWWKRSCGKSGYVTKHYRFSKDFYFNDCALSDTSFIVGVLFGALKGLNSFIKFTYWYTTMLIISNGAHLSLAKYYTSKCDYRGAIINIHFYGVVEAKPICRFW